MQDNAYGFRNTGFLYHMCNTGKKDFHELAETTEENDLGIMVTNDLNWKSQCLFAVTKTENDSNTFTRPSAETLKKVYCY